MRIDSVNASGDSIFYYPFHTPRGSYETILYTDPLVLDSTGGSWLGGNVLQKSDGTFLFDNLWGDSVVIKSLAHTGDSWVFYTDSGNIYYQATVLVEDTMTVLSSSDSIKTISVSAYNSAGIVTTDPLNGFEIILSKEHGFVQVFDLYTFPYHKPDSVYRVGLDFYLDRSLCNIETITTLPGVGAVPNGYNAIFKLVNFIPPSDQQLHNWNIGDAMLIRESRLETGAGFPHWVYNYIRDTVISKTVLVNATDYYLRGIQSSYMHFPASGTVSHSVAHTFSDAVFRISDTSFMPEDCYHWSDRYTFYFPFDSSYCLPGPSYSQKGRVFQVGGLGMGYGSKSVYKSGVGLVSSSFVDGAPAANGIDVLSFNGRRNCSPTRIADTYLNQSDQVNIYPNPALSEVTIDATFKISSIVITNTVGQIVYNQVSDNRQVHINLESLISGLYFVKINGTTVKRFIKY